MYCRIKDEKIIEQYNTLPFRIRIDATTTRTSLYELSEAELNEIGIYKCRIEIPIYNSSTSYLGDIIETYDKINNEYVISYEVVAKTALEIEIEEKEKLDTDISTLKDIRVTKIKDGYVFKEHTYFIDRDDKIDLLIEKNKAEANPLYENYWKTMEGDWVLLKNQDIIDLANQVFDYVSSLYIEEKDAVELIAPEKIYDETVVETEKE